MTPWWPARRSGRNSRRVIRALRVTLHSTGDVVRVGLSIYDHITVAGGRREVRDGKNKVRNIAGGGVK